MNNEMKKVISMVDSAEKTTVISFTPVVVVNYKCTPNIEYNYNMLTKKKKKTAVISDNNLVGSKWAITCTIFYRCFYGSLQYNK